MRAAVAFALWTLFVWATRLRNVWDSSESTGARVWSTFLAFTFVALAVVTLVACWRRWDRAQLHRLLTVFLGWTVVAWAVRVVAIAGDHHGAAFTIVHTALAVISVTLGVVAVRATAPARAALRS
jgi:hypothetical protein